MIIPFLEGFGYGVLAAAAVTIVFALCMILTIDWSK